VDETTPGQYPEKEGVMFICKRYVGVAEQASLAYLTNKEWKTSN